MRATITMCHKFVDLSKQRSRKADLIGGEGGIRTLGTFNSTPDFESGTFDHSATSPNQGVIIASEGVIEWLN